MRHEVVDGWRRYGAGNPEDFWTKGRLYLMVGAQNTAGAQMNLFDSIEKLLADGIDPESRSREIWSRFGHRYAPMVIDSSGFTRITEQQGPLHYLSCLVQMRALVLPVLEKYDARMHTFEADNAIAYFEEVDQAVEAVVDINHVISSAGIRLTRDEPYTICAGIGYGDLLYSETLEGCFGHEMNLASKLGEDIANANQLLMSMAAYQACSLDIRKAMKPGEMEISGVNVTYYQLDIA